MQVSNAIMLTDRERATIARITCDFAERIGEIRVFGSRATGRARADSDLDVVVYPPVTQRDLYDMADAFEDSDLPIFVDILAWEQITSDVLRDEITRYSVPLIAKECER